MYRTVPVVYMARDVMILMRVTSIHKGHWKGWALKKIGTFMGPEIATSEASAILGPKKSSFAGITPFQWPE